MKDMSVVNAPRRWIDGYDSFAVWGIASSGVAAANLLARHGKRVCISDPRSREVLSTHLEQLHEDVEVHCGANTFGDAQVVVTSPGLPPRLALFQEAADKSIPVISEIELAFDAAVAPFVCITGTDGKTTTTSLIGAILERAGLEHVVAGNIGIPLCDVVEDISADGFIVAEVSAFQLWTTHHFHPLMACFTNLAGDHLDYFEGDFEAYGHAKKMLIQNMDPAHDRLWVNGEDHTSVIWSEQFGKRAGVFVLGRERLLDALTNHVGPLSMIDDGKMLYLPEGVSASSADGIVLVEDISTLSLHGRHNQKNMLCAASMCFELGIAPEVIQDTMREFKGLPHRFEEVCFKDGVRFIDDSKATNAHAALAGLSGVDFESLVVITGGVDKGLDLSGFTTFLSSSCAHIITLGQLAQRLEDELVAQGYEMNKIRRVESMEEAVKVAYELAKPTQAAVVLSPASSSFDMFKSYAHRGEVFQAAVHAL